MTTKDQVLMLATHVDYYKQACERLTAELATVKPPAPDCRTCANYAHDDDHPQCKLWNGCTNGDQYQPAPAVVLWRTE